MNNFDKSSEDEKAKEVVSYGRKDFADMWV